MGSLEKNEVFAIRAPEPLPAAITASQPGTFAHDSMTRRIREEILQRIWTENDFRELPEEDERQRVMQNLKALDSELQLSHSSMLRHIQEPGAEDLLVWRRILDRINAVGHLTWLTCPWIVAEYYLYRRILEACEFARTKFDPFKRQKWSGLTSSVAAMQSMASRVLPALSQLEEAQRAGNADVAALTEAIRTTAKLFVEGSLWGNQADLSLWPVAVKGPNEKTAAAAPADTDLKTSTGSKSEQLLSDDFNELLNCLTGIKLAEKQRQISIFTDNAGFELFCDLCLADFFVSAGLAERVVFRVKTAPVYVSDAMESDLRESINFFAAHESPELKNLGLRWSQYLSGDENGATQFLVKPEPFSVLPSAFWEMPSSLVEELQPDVCDLVVVKGDANYRRLLGDRSWPLDTPFRRILSYFPTRILALRTLKSEVGCGIPVEVAAKAAAKDPKWLVDGKFAVLQFSGTHAAQQPSSA